MNDISLPSVTPDIKMENSAITDHPPIICDNDPIISLSEEHQQKLPSSYLSLSIGDHEHAGLSDFRDPLFYQQPLHLHYYQSVPAKTGSEHETGDRIRMTNNFRLHQSRKQRSATLHKHPIGKSRSTHQSKKSHNRARKTREKKKKVSKRNLKKRKQTSKIVNRSSLQQLRNQSRTRHQDMSLKKKKKLLKQRVVSKKRLISKVNKNKSLTTCQYARKLNTTNNPATSILSSRRSSTSRPARTRSMNQSKTETTGAQSSSTVGSIENPDTQIVSNKIKQQTHVSIFDPIFQLNNKQENKQLLPTHNNHLFSKARSSTRLEQKLSKKSLRRSKFNGRKSSTYKSKQRNRGGTKLNIRSPVHTTFKKSVRRYRKRPAVERKIKFPQCSSKTLITTGPLNTNNENIIKPIDINNDDIRTKMSSVLFSLKNDLITRQSAMPLVKNCAQLTSKNNNRRAIEVVRCGNSSISKRTSTRR